MDLDQPAHNISCKAVRKILAVFDLAESIMKARDIDKWEFSGETSNCGPCTLSFQNGALLVIDRFGVVYHWTAINIECAFQLTEWLEYCPIGANWKELWRKNRP